MRRLLIPSIAIAIGLASTACSVSFGTKGTGADQASILSQSQSPAPLPGGGGSIVAVVRRVLPAVVPVCGPASDSISSVFPGAASPIGTQT